MRAKDLGILFVLAAIWGSSYLFIRVAVPTLGPLLVALARVSVAAAGLLVWLAVSKQRGQFRFDRRFVAIGALNAAMPYVLISYAEIHMTASLASILNATTPLFAALAAAAWAGRRPHSRVIVGCLLGLAGVGVLAGWEPGAGGLSFYLAVAAMLASSFSYGVATVYAKHKLAGVSALGAATGQQLGAAVLLIPVGAAAVATGHGARPSLGVAAAMLALGLICTSFAYLLYFRLIASAGAVNTSSVTFLIPIFGIAWSALFLSEPAPRGTLPGLALIFASILLVTGRGLPIAIPGVVKRRTGATREARS
jgi:drug/metabolite transporter (DMT)-like permease